MLELKNRPLSNYDLTTTQSSNLSLVPNYNSHQAKMDMLIEKFKNLNINEPSREINLKKTDPIRSLLNQQIYEIFHILLFNCKGIPLKETKAICLTSQYYATFLSNNLLKIKLDTYQVLDSINPNICPKNLYKLYCSNYVLSSKEINDLYTWTKLYRATTLIENIDLFPTNNIQNYIPSQIDAYNKKGYKNILNTSYEEYQTIGLINDFFKLIYFTDDILFDHTFINPHKITLENLPILLESIITKCSKFAEIIENLNIQSEIFYEIPSGIEI